MPNTMPSVTNKCINISLFEVFCYSSSLLLQKCGQCCAIRHPAHAGLGWTWLNFQSSKHLLCQIAAFWSRSRDSNIQRWRDAPDLAPPWTNQSLWWDTVPSERGAPGTELELPIFQFAFLYSLCPQTGHQVWEWLCELAGQVMSDSTIPCKCMHILYICFTRHPPKPNWTITQL